MILKVTRMGKYKCETVAIGDLFSKIISVQPWWSGVKSEICRYYPEWLFIVAVIKWRVYRTLWTTLRRYLNSSYIIFQCNNTLDVWPQENSDGERILTSRWIGKCHWRIFVLLLTVRTGTVLLGNDISTVFTKLWRKRDLHTLPRMTFSCRRNQRTCL